MRKMFFLEYEDDLNRAKSILLQYYLEFDQKKSMAYNSFLSGTISEEDYNRIKGYRIDEYHEDDKEYFLSKEQVDFVREYASLDENGEILLDSLNPKYDMKLAQLKSVFESIRMFNYCESLDLDELRTLFSFVVSDYYDATEKKLQEALNSNKDEVLIDEKVIAREAIPGMLDKLSLHKQNAIDKICISSREELRSYISKFYKIDYKYFTWYSLRKLQYDAKDKKMYQGHQDRLADIVLQYRSLNEKRDRYNALVNEFDTLNNQYRDFLSVASVVMTIPIKKKVSLKGLAHKNNLSELAEIFTELFGIAGMEEYIKSLDSYNITDPFQIYMSNVYPLINYVDVNDFREKLLENLRLFYENKISKCRLEMQELNNLMTLDSKTLEDELNVASDEASYNRMAVCSLDNKASLDGFTTAEEDRIFSDMLAYFATDYNKDIAVNMEKRNIDELRNGKRNN